jgi:hypothetical protein
MNLEKAVHREGRQGREGREGIYRETIFTGLVIFIFASSIMTFFANFVNFASLR